jgi:hypothetical protein
LGESFWREFFIGLHPLHNGSQSGDLAENEVAFKAAGYNIKAETFNCPNMSET